ncbi:hypothetical protein BDN70DRAFT_379528 [Pholiota conissans]|uniref:Uncharacterized protein n=1 Tax=Pholiota conissans TaxID=109636 RepID=A0A9P5Z8P4_9AGAR|nr:hypothetical protein BDN70DRAFT_379528 [Pholiota conissans]
MSSAMEVLSQSCGGSLELLLDLYSKLGIDPLSVIEGTGSSHNNSSHPLYDDTPPAPAQKVDIDNAAGMSSVETASRLQRSSVAGISRVESSLEENENEIMMELSDASPQSDSLISTNVPQSTTGSTATPPQAGPSQAPVALTSTAAALLPAPQVPPQWTRSFCQLSVPFVQITNTVATTSNANAANVPPLVALPANPPTVPGVPNQFRCRWGPGHCDHMFQSNISSGMFLRHLKSAHGLDGRKLKADGSPDERTATGGKIYCLWDGCRAKGSQTLLANGLYKHIVDRPTLGHVLSPL